MRIGHLYIEVLRAESGDWVHTLPDGTVERHLFSVCRVSGGVEKLTQVILWRWAWYFGWLR